MSSLIKDSSKISDTYHSWSGKEFNEKYKDLSGFCKSVGIEDVRKTGYVLTPGRYIEFRQVDHDQEGFEEKMKHLTSALGEQMTRATELDMAIRKNLQKLGYEF